MVNKKLITFILCIFVFGSFVSAWSVNITKYNNEPLRAQPYYGSELDSFSYNITCLEDASNISSISWKYNTTGGIVVETQNTGEFLLTNSITSVSSIEGNNTLILNVTLSNNDSQSFTHNFWVDSIEPNLSIVTPSGGNGYTNSNTLSLIANLFEVNKGGYAGDVFASYNSSDKFIWRLFSYPLSGGTWNSFTLDGSNNSDLLQTLTNPADLQEGNYTFQIKSRDQYPNGTTIREVIKEGWIFRDVSDPVVEILSPLNDTNHSSFINIHSNASDNLSGVDSINISIYNESSVLMNSSSCGSNDCFFNWNSALVDDGSYTIVATAFDRAGNDDSEQILIRVDNTDPEIYFNSPVADIYNSSQLINITAFDAHLTNITLFVDGSYVNHSYSDSLLYSLAGEGNHSVYAIAFDSFGNSNQTETRNIVIDLTPPAILIDSPMDGFYNNATQLINLSMVDHFLEGSIWYNWNGTNASYSAPIFTTFNESSNVLHVWANDSVGNLNYTSVSFIVDTIAPNISFEAPTTSEGNYSQNYIVSNISAADNNFKNITIHLYNSEGIVQENSTNSTDLFMNFTDLSDGVYFINATACDSANNCNYTSTMEYLLDTTGPLVSLVSLNNSAFDVDSMVFLEFNYSDVSLIDGCSLFLSEVINQTRSDVNVFNLTGLVPGRYNWSVRCNDSLSNVNSSETMYFTVLENVTFSDNTTEHTNLSNQSDISDVLYFFISNQYGAINWTSSIDFSEGFDWGKCINMSFNRFEINSSCFEGFNVSALITFYNLSWSNPQVMKDGAVCSDCNKISYNSTSGELIFSVSGFSVYETRETPVVASSGGGGSSSRCTTEWVCTDWSVCVGGIQTRTCSYLSGLCAPLDDKPITSQSCIVEEEEDSNVSGDDSEEVFDLEDSDEKKSLLTGFAIGEFFDSPVNISVVLLIVVGLGVLSFVVIRKRNSLKKVSKEESEEIDYT